MLRYVLPFLLSTYDRVVRPASFGGLSRLADIQDKV